MSAYSNCTSHCRGLYEHYDPILGILISIEVDPVTDENGLVKCVVCDRSFIDHHEYCLHQLSSGHLYWLHREWKR